MVLLSLIWNSGCVTMSRRFDGHKHGKGKLDYVNGDVYDGDWVMDTWHGKAKFVNAKGDVYVGGKRTISWDSTKQ